MICNSIRNGNDCKKHDCTWVVHSHKRSYCRKPHNSKIPVPKKGCNAYSIKSYCDEDADCLWVAPKDKAPFCRKRKNNRHIPEDLLQKMALLDCNSLKTQEACKKKNHCAWIDPGNKKAYCRKTTRCNDHKPGKFDFFDIFSGKKKQWHMIETDNPFITTKKIYEVDMGGGGSCLYYSIAGGFCELVQNYKINESNPKYQKIYDRLLTNKGYLREIVAGSLTTKWLKHQLQTMGYDNYKNPFFWMGIGFDEDIAQEIAYEDSLQEALATARQKKLDLGTFAGEFDLNRLRDFLNIGFYIINPHQAAINKVFYCNNTEKKYPYYILLHNLAYVGSRGISHGWHYRLAGIYINDLKIITGGIAAQDMPPWFVKRYHQECVSDRLLVLREALMKIHPFPPQNKKKNLLCQKIYYENPLVGKKKFIQSFVQEMDE